MITITAQTGTEVGSVFLASVLLVFAIPFCVRQRRLINRPRRDLAVLREEQANQFGAGFQTELSHHQKGNNHGHH